MLLVAVSAVAFGAMAIFARFAYDGGADVHGVLLARFGLAGAVLAALMAATRRPWPRGRSLAVAIGMGGLGYVGQSLCYFSALEHASAGLVALLLYAYPTIVCLLGALFLHERITGRTAVLLAVSFAGIALTLGGGRGSATGIALGLAAALFYSVYIVVGARELRGTDALASTAVVCLAAFTVLALATPLHAPRFPQGAAAWAATVAIALVSTVVAILAFFAGLKRVGASTAAIMSTIEPVVTVGLAWLLLAEKLAPTQLFGGALVLSASVLLARTRTLEAGPTKTQMEKF